MSYSMGTARYKLGRGLLHHDNFEGQTVKQTTSVEAHFSTERSKETSPHCSDERQQQQQSRIANEMTDNNSREFSKD
jgi:hypothetical protein